jgi:hypothetical protein
MSILEPASAVVQQAARGAVASWLARMEAERRAQVRRRFVKSLATAAATMLAGIAAAVAFEGTLKTVGLVILAVSGVSLLACQVVVVAIDDLARAPTLTDKIATLAASLNTAALAIDEVDREVQARRALVTQLENDAARDSQISALHRQEVEAIAQTLRGELDLAGRRSFRSGLIQNAVFFALGIGASILVSVLFGA